MSRVPVKLVVADREAPFARQVADVLRAAAIPLSFGDGEISSPQGLYVLIDDESLPRALSRFIMLLPGLVVFANVILCVERPEAAGGLLAEGFRDVVAPKDLPRAVEALLGGGPPVLLAQLRHEIEHQLLPRFAERMRESARDKHRLLGECLDLVRARAYLDKRVHALSELLARQSLDEIHVLQGRIESFLDNLSDRRTRWQKLPRFPEVDLKRNVLGKHEPRYSRARTEVADTVDRLRATGLLAALGKDGAAELAETAENLKRTPLQALRECQRIVDRELAMRLTDIGRGETEVDPLAAIEEECRDRYGVGVVPPGIAVPDYVRLIMRSLASPPPEVYLSWCLDLRDLELKLCADVFADIARALAADAGGPRRVPLPFAANLELKDQRP